MLQLSYHTHTDTDAHSVVQKQHREKFVVVQKQHSFHLFTKLMSVFP